MYSFRSILFFLCFFSSTLDFLDADDLTSLVAILEIPGNIFLVFGHKIYLHCISITLQVTQRMCSMQREENVFWSSIGWGFLIIYLGYKHK